MSTTKPKKSVKVTKETEPNGKVPEKGPEPNGKVPEKGPEPKETTEPKETESRGKGPASSEKRVKQKSFDDLLREYQIKSGSGAVSTNTRIPNPNNKNNPYGGSYSVPDDQYEAFINTYYNYVIHPGKIEHMTEKQLEAKGPLLMDLDFHYPENCSERLYTDDHLEHFVAYLVSRLARVYELNDEESVYTIAVLEKPTPQFSPKHKIYKDGLHIIIGIQSDLVTQTLFRKQMLADTQLADIFASIPLSNSWASILDEGVAKGDVNWQMYGSRKPGCDAYRLTHLYKVGYNEAENDADIEEADLCDFPFRDFIYGLSARYDRHPYFMFTQEFMDIRAKHAEQGQRVAAAAVNAAGAGGGSGVSLATSNVFSNSFTMLQALVGLSSKDDIKSLAEEFIAELTKDKELTGYDMRETYELVMCLPESYYGSGSYTNWIRVGWVLRNMDDRLFIVFAAFSAQSSTFQMTDLMDLFDRWQGFQAQKQDGLTKRSLVHWLMTESPDKYKAVRSNSVDYMVEKTLGISNKELEEGKLGTVNDASDAALARVLYKLYGDRFVCVNYKNSIWYNYRDHHWVEIDGAVALRRAISEDLCDLYRNKIRKLMAQKASETDENKIKYFGIKIDRASAIASQLESNNAKKRIMNEAHELFYDEEFFKKIDTDPNLMCFTNGVVDFKNHVFRPGRPEDYITMTTRIPYVKPTKEKHGAIMECINEFMHKLFPVQDLYEYMFEHLASVLIGTAVNQTFNMYIGVGSNGKSVLITLMEKILGDYKVDVPLSMLTDKRAKVGGVSPEVIMLKGARYAVVQESSKGDRMNEGVMKQMTSKLDPLQGRGLWMAKPITFVPQFSLVLCSNEFMEITSQDNGTWRRMRVCDFMALFTENPVQGDPDKPYQFPMDKNISEKFDEWKEVFMGMLVQKAFETNGKVRDCPAVMRASEAYRASQDCMAEFIQDRIIKDANGRIEKTELVQEFRQWYEGIYGRGGKTPKPRDVQNYMDKTFGKYEKNKCWKGVRIQYKNQLYGSGDEDEITTIASDGEDVRLCDLGA
jgi:P4 family phage/plasmid primase-like protien